MIDDNERTSPFNDPKPFYDGQGYVRIPVTEFYDDEGFLHKAEPPVKPDEGSRERPDLETKQTPRTVIKIKISLKSET